MDRDHSKNISFDEFVAYFCEHERVASAGQANKARNDDSWVEVGDAGEIIAEMVDEMMKEAYAQVEVLVGEMMLTEEDMASRRRSAYVAEHDIQGLRGESPVERFYADEEAEVLQLSPVIETPPEPDSGFHIANDSRIRSQLEDAADRLDGQADDGDPPSKDLQTSRPSTSASSDLQRHHLFRQGGAPGLSRPSTGMASHYSGEAPILSRPTTGSGSNRRSRPTTSKTKDLQLSRPGTSDRPVQVSRPTTSGSSFARAPGGHTISNRLSTPEGLGPRSRSAASGMTVIPLFMIIFSFETLFPNTARRSNCRLSRHVTTFVHRDWTSAGPERREAFHGLLVEMSCSKHKVCKKIRHSSRLLEPHRRAGE